MTSITVRIDEDVKKEAETLFRKLGLSVSSAVNVFFRQAIIEQAIPFPVRTKAEKEYDEYFTPEVIESIKHSAAQADRGEVINFTPEEFYAMAAGDIPQRALDFLATGKEAEGASHD